MASTQGKPFSIANATVSKGIIETLVNEFPDVIKDTMNEKPMKGPPMELEFDSTMTVRPKRFSYVKHTPLHLKSAANDVIQELLDKNIIVPVTEPTDWCSPAFFVGKPDGRARLVTNFIYLNQFVKRPVHPFPSPRDILRTILPESQCFITFDCKHGYFQIGLSEAAS